MMNGDTTIKENANPVIHEVDKDLKHRKRQKPLGWSIVDKFTFTIDENDDDDNAWMLDCHDNDGDHVEDWSLIRTAEDHAIYHALADASAATNGKGVAMLRSIGFVFPTTTATIGTEPLAFVPSDLPASWKERIPHNQRDAVDAEEIFDIIRTIQDPEHPLTLEQLGVVSRNQIQVYDHAYELLQQQTSSANQQQSLPNENYSTVDVRFTPTIPHCSMATLIGLCIKVKLIRSLASRFKITVRIQPGTHASEQAVNKQLADKERVCAALENAHLLGVVNRCIANGMRGEMQ